MDKETIIRYNKAIATYLGYVYVPFNNKEGLKVKCGWQKPDIKFTNHKYNPRWYLCRSHNDLPYYRDWNHLMEAVEKIFNDFPEGEHYLYKLGIYEPRRRVFEEVGSFIESLTIESITL